VVSEWLPRKKIFADEHSEQRLQDIWKDSQTPAYPTEKNIDLLRTIVQTSSNPGNLVLDA
jgi:adenine-specific DNA-methyltransferase